MDEESKLYHKAGDILEEIMSGIEKGSVDRKELIVRKKWSYIAGNRLCRYGSFVKCEHSTLYIKADSRNYVTIFLLNRNGILRRYNEVVPSDRALLLSVTSDQSMYGSQM